MLVYISNTLGHNVFIISLFYDADLPIQEARHLYSSYVSAWA